MNNNDNESQIRLTMKDPNTHATTFLCFNCAVRAVLDDNTPIKQEVDCQSKYGYVPLCCEKCTNELE